MFKWNAYTLRENKRINIKVKDFYFYLSLKVQHFTSFPAVWQMLAQNTTPSQAVKTLVLFVALTVIAACYNPHAHGAISRTGRLTDSLKVILEICRKFLSESDVCLSEIPFLFLSPPDMNYRSTSPRLSSKSSRPSSGLPWWHGTCSKCRPWTRTRPEHSFWVRLLY